MTRGKEVGIGVAFFLVGFFCILSNWLDIASKGKFRVGMAIWSPVVLIAGIMLIAIPYPDKSKFPKAEFAPKAWAWFIGVGAILGFLNFYLLMFGF